MCYEIISRECVDFVCQSTGRYTTEHFIIELSYVFYESHSDILPKIAEIALEKKITPCYFLLWSEILKGMYHLTGRALRTFPSDYCSIVLSKN